MITLVSGFQHSIEKLFNSLANFLNLSAMQVNVESSLVYFHFALSYSLMLDCWKQVQDERPSFQELFERLEQLMLQEVEYLDFNKIDQSKDYYQVEKAKAQGDDDN